MLFEHAISSIQLQDDSDSEDELHYTSYSTSHSSINETAVVTAANRRVLMSVLKLANTLSNGK
jgi:hypothetical protein